MISIKLSTIHRLGLAFCFALPIHCMAQEDGLGGEIQIIRTVENQVDPGQKLDAPANETPIQIPQEKMVYEVPNRLIRLKYEPNNLKPVKLPTEKAAEQQNNFIEAGFGYLLSPLVNASFQHLKNENFRAGFKVHHFSARSSRENQRMGETEINGNFSLLMKKNESGIQLNWKNDLHHFYGYNSDSESYARDSVKQTINTYGGSLFTRNSQVLKGNWNYSLQLPFRFLQNKDSLTEIATGAELLIEKSINAQHGLSFSVGDQFHVYKPDSIIKRNTVQIQLKYNFRTNDFKANAALGGGGEKTAFYLLPAIGAEYHLYKNYLVLDAGWNRKLQINSFQSLVLANPFILDHQQMRNSRKESLYAAVSGTLGDVDYRLGFNKLNTRQMPLFVQSSRDAKRFDVFYERKLQTFNLHAEAAYALHEQLRIKWSNDYNIYKADSATKAWNLPGFESNLTATYNFKNKIGLQLDIFALQGIYGRLANGEDVLLKPAVDVNIRGDYHISKKFTAFLQLNNIASIKHERFPNYPTFGFNAIVGIKFSY